MRLIVVSHKPCWRCAASPAGYASSGGFPFQMGALSELFDSTTLATPVIDGPLDGEIPLNGRHLAVEPLTSPRGTDGWRKAGFPLWTARNLPRLIRAILRADAVHVPIPGDIGTIGMLLAAAFRKPLFVRYCGNWLAQTTTAESFWKWFMERQAGGRNVMLATGGALDPPSSNPAVRWIFSTTLTRHELYTIRQQRLSRQHGRARLIIVCRQDGGKGTEVLIDALPLVARDFPSVSLAVVGDGTALSNLRMRAERAGVTDRVTFHGAVSHESVIRLLRRADLFCYPTSTEGFPKVVLEALACGLPIVTTNVSVLPQLVNGCGVLLERTTAEAVAHAIRLSLSDADRYEAWSSCAVARAGQYSLEQWRDTIGEVLRAAWGPLQSQGCNSTPRAGRPSSSRVETFQ
jgi:glycosyl transferase family 1